MKFMQIKRQYPKNNESGYKRLMFWRFFHEKTCQHIQWSLYSLPLTSFEGQKFAYWSSIT